MLHRSNFMVGHGPAHEQERIAALADLQVVDGGPEETFDRIARLAKASLGFPLAYVSLIDLDRQILKTHVAEPVCDGSRNTAFCSVTIETQDVLVITDTLADERFSRFPQVVGEPHIRSYWGVPLTTRMGFNVGALCVLDRVPRNPRDGDLSLLKELGRLTVECMELRAQATTDVLTGVQCRRSFFAEGERLFATRHAERQPLSCVVLDVDHFKRINDEFGHAVGDDVLRTLGDLLRNELRPDSVAGRIGGEEFAILLPGESILAAFAVGERLRVKFADLGGHRLPPVSASFGLAERSDSDVVLGDLVRRADQQTYMAKRAGRNCTYPKLALAAPAQTAALHFEISDVSDILR